MAYLFISYSKQDQEYTNQVAEFLLSRGFNVWIDEERIESGVDWWDSIVRAVKSCAAVVVVMSPASATSDWVKREVFLALEWKKPVLPLLLDGENWSVFITTQFEEVQGGKLPSQEFLERLSAYLTPQQQYADRTLLVSPFKAVKFDLRQALAKFFEAFNAKRWSDSLEMLGRIRASGEDVAPFDPDDFEQRIHTALRNENYEVAAQRQYEIVKVMAQHATPDVVWAAMQKLWQDFPGYDPDGLRLYYEPTKYMPKPTTNEDTP